MDKKTVALMLSEDLARLQREFLELEKRLGGLVQDVKNYISSLLDQVSSGEAFLLVYNPRKTFPQLASLMEENNITDSTLNLSRRTSQMDVEPFSDCKRNTSRRDADALKNQNPVVLGVLKPPEVSIVKPRKKFIIAADGIENQCDNVNILGTTEVSTSRSRREASVRATERIKKLQSMNLKTKLRRQIKDRVGRGYQPNQWNNLSPDPYVMTELNNESDDLQIENVTISSKKDRKMHESVQGLLDMDTEDMNKTLSSDFSMKQNFSNNESAVERIDCSKVQWKNFEESKYTSELEKILEESAVTYCLSKSSVSLSRTANASKNFKQKSHMNKTVDDRNVTETATTIYADVIHKFLPITNSTRDPGDFEMLEKNDKKISVS